MRRIATAALALAIAIAARADGVNFVRVWPGWRDASSFTRISDYFGGRSDDSGWVIRRTHSNRRDGYYFVVRVNHPEIALTGGKFLLRMIMPDSPDPKVFTFPIGPKPPAGDVFELGLTGSDWPGRKTQPVAWRLEFVSPDGRPLASQQSFLWAKP